jgi:hypothetical protein
VILWLYIKLTCITIRVSVKLQSAQDPAGDVDAVRQAVRNYAAVTVFYLSIILRVPILQVLTALDSKRVNLRTLDDLDELAQGFIPVITEAHHGFNACNSPSLVS